MSRYNDKFVLQTNKETNIHVSRYNYKFVSKGFQQIHVIDYDETIYLIENMDSIRLDLSIAASRGY